MKNAPSQIFTFRRSASLGIAIALALILLQVRHITTICRPFLGLNSAPGVVQAAPVAAAAPAVVKRPSKQVHPVQLLGVKLQVPVFPPTTHKKVEEPVRELNNAHLQSYARDYMVTISGTATCAGKPCAADIDLSIETATHPATDRHATSAPDGQFQIPLTLHDYQHEQIDWHITAQAPGFKIAELRGRQILMDESMIAVDAVLALR
jgi:hypothetical protein